jgi:hypothetical protein
VVTSLDRFVRTTTGILNAVDKLTEKRGVSIKSLKEVVPSSVELRWRPDDHQAAFTFSS